MDAGEALVLTFRAQAGGPALAVANVKLEGCGFVDLTIGGKEQPGLGNPSGGTSVATQVMKIAGLTWKLGPTRVVTPPPVLQPLSPVAPRASTRPSPAASAVPRITKYPVNRIPAHQHGPVL